ncbi:hypothetical protein CsSME_00037727 [Camellia sinensis var. sinensis]
MEKFKRYLELDRSQQHDFVYPLIFQEYIYALAHDHEGFIAVVEIPFSLFSLEGQIFTSKLCVRYTNTPLHPSGNLSSNSSLLGKRCLFFVFITILSPYVLELLSTKK